MDGTSPSREARGLTDLIAQLGGDVSKFVFPSVEKWLQEKVAALDAEPGQAAQP